MDASTALSIPHMSLPSHLWARIRSQLVAKVSLTVGLVGVGMATLFAMASIPYIQDNEADRHAAYIRELLTTVESTAQIACFTADKTLASELARGLLTNQVIAGVRIESGPQVLVDMRKTSTTRMESRVVRKTITSPFDSNDAVGRIVLTADDAYIRQQASAYSRFFALAFLLEVLAITVAVMWVILRTVVHPITDFARTLQGSGCDGNAIFLPPKGNEENEIGHLAQVFNQMMARVSSVLAKEYAMREELALREQQFRSLAENSPGIIARYDRALRLVFGNPSYARVTGHDCDPVQPHHARLLRVMETGSPEIMQWDWRTPDGRIVCHEMHVVAEYDTRGDVQGILAIGHDITERREIEHALLHQATHDALTGLPNRVLLKDRLEHALSQARRGDHELGVVFIDLDHFKDINDRYGHDIGDEFLKQVAQRLRGVLRASDTVARLGGDEFVVLLEGIQGHVELDATINKMFDALSLVCDVDDALLYPSASLGIAVYPGDGDDADTLMRNADMAMYSAKHAGRNQFCHFRADMNAELTEWMDLSLSLRQAVSGAEFLLHYQPKVSLRDGKLIGMEALIRWQHPERGLVSPACFIPVAEKNGLIGTIGLWVLDESCRQMRAWLGEGLTPGRMAVNLSALQFQDEHLTSNIGKTLAKHGLPGECLELEVTETLLLEDAQACVQALTTLRDMGIRISVDDFGTGYSSLSYLKRLPLDSLKIDKSFVKEMESDGNDVTIVRTIIAMAHAMRLEVVAEGVETESQLAQLCAAGCDHMQGYHYSRPLAANDMLCFLRSGDTLKFPVVPMRNKVVCPSL